MSKVTTLAEAREIIPASALATDPGAQRLSELEPAVTPQRLLEFPLTDSGNAERFSACWRNRVRFARDIGGGAWLVWTGTHWQRDLHGEAQMLVLETARLLGTEGKRLLGQAQALGNGEAKKQAVSEAKKIMAHAHRCEGVNGDENPRLFGENRS